MSLPLPMSWDRLIFAARRTWLLVALALVAATTVGHAAAAKKWELLTDCQYVPDANNDGDSFKVRHGEKTFFVRLYYVDAPEVTLAWPERTREQSLHFGVSLDAALKGGMEAQTRVQGLLAKPFVVRTRWATAPGRGAEARFYAIVDVADRSLAEILVTEGLARTKGVAPNPPTGGKAREYMDRLRDLESIARDERRGVWNAQPVAAEEAQPGT